MPLVVVDDDLEVEPAVEIHGARGRGPGPAGRPGSGGRCWTFRSAIVPCRSPSSKTPPSGRAERAVELVEQRDIDQRGLIEVEVQLAAVGHRLGRVGAVDVDVPREPARHRAAAQLLAADDAEVDVVDEQPGAEVAAVAQDEMGLAADAAAGQPALGPPDRQRAPRDGGSDENVQSPGTCRSVKLQAVDDIPDRRGTRRLPPSAPSRRPATRSVPVPASRRSASGRKLSGAGQHDPLDAGASTPYIGPPPVGSRYIQIPSPPSLPPNSSPPSGPTRQPSGDLLTSAWRLGPEQSLVESPDELVELDRALAHWRATGPAHRGARTWPLTDAWPRRSASGPAVPSAPQSS